MNYKNITFENNLKEFKRWCNEFEPLERGTDVEIYNKGDYYLSLEKVSGYFKGNYSFVGATLMEYDHKDKDFVCCFEDEAKELFQEELDNYKKKHNLKTGGF